jgi:hypothetical protein
VLFGLIYHLSFQCCLAPFVKSVAAVTDTWTQKCEKNKPGPQQAILAFPSEIITHISQGQAISQKIIVSD